MAQVAGLSNSFLSRFDFFISRFCGQASDTPAQPPEDPVNVNAAPGGRATGSQGCWAAGDLGTVAPFFRINPSVLAALLIADLSVNRTLS